MIVKAFKVGVEIVSKSGDSEHYEMLFSRDEGSQAIDIAPYCCDIVLDDRENLLISVDNLVSVLRELFPEKFESDRECV